MINMGIIQDVVVGCNQMMSVELCSADNEVSNILRGLNIIAIYRDHINKDQQSTRTLRIQVERIRIKAEKE